MWSSPENARIIAEKITTKLAEISPENREYFEANLKKFNDELDSILSEFN
ncbi:MAG: zinc ABC transporter substrate-binding protein [Candidatus Peribacteria bacterium]|nr:zinc ABC transporter substrate-binding protein [Candidatus Peribacteria bacterium]